MDYTLTSEQQRIIEHPLHRHARVLAVAGSGKTTTMVHRVHHLVADLNCSAARIRIVMFNRLAREDFQKKLATVLPPEPCPKVLTFHALAYRMRADAQREGLLPEDLELWIEDKQELALRCMNETIDSLVREGYIERDIDPVIALDAVSLWKASLIPPERAGHRTDPDLPIIYRRFEQLRTEARALTFDDFVPAAMEAVESNPGFRRRWTNRLDHLIVDEYQDINYGQQMLVKLLAGTRADVMVVGDDDQTIYEWRGARPSYILQGFRKDFNNKPIVDYELPHSFRFGPLLAQCAHNVIGFNRERESKSLRSYRVDQRTRVEVLADESEQGHDIALEMARQIVALVKDGEARPEAIGVLGRTYAQLESLQAVFIQRGVPFRVLGMAPFFERRENRVLLDYIRLALALDKPPAALEPWRNGQDGTEGEEPPQSRVLRRQSFQYKGPYGEAIQTILSVANTPNRLLSRIALRKAVDRGGKRGRSLEAALSWLVQSRESYLPTERHEALRDLIGFLHRIAERIENEPTLEAGELLDWMIDYLEYREHFEDYYGEGRASLDRIASVNNFVSFAAGTGQGVKEFIAYLGTLDTMQGLKSNEVITMTSVHRTKGLEFDYVFIPACTEGYMPVHIADETEIYDTEGIVPTHPSSPPLESERRLFYVAVTRAIKYLCIGTRVPPSTGGEGSSPPTPSRFLEEMRLEPTRAIVEALQAAVDGEPIDEFETRSLREQARRNLGLRQVIHSMRSHYGDRKLGIRLDGWLEELAQGVPDSPFQYAHRYPELRVVGGLGPDDPTEPDALSPEAGKVWNNLSL